MKKDNVSKNWNPIKNSQLNIPGIDMAYEDFPHKHQDDPVWDILCKDYWCFDNEIIAISVLLLLLSLSTQLRTRTKLDGTKWVSLEHAPDKVGIDMHA